jgi:hypothetical protein
MANRKISDLTALTAPATGDLLPIVDISEAAAADKNKKITIGELFASIPAGTAAAPSVAFEGDSNTGIYSPGADQIGISANGTSRIVVNASGLDVAGTFRSTGIARLGTAQTTVLAYIGDPDTVGNKYIYFARTSALTDIVNIQGADAGVGIANIALQAGGGRVGIGATNPGSFTPGNLVVEAATTAGITISDSTGAGTASIAFSATSSFQNRAKINCTMSSQSLEFSTAGSERARIDSSGRLLVGTSSDQGTATLQIQGDSASGANWGKVFLRRGQAIGTIGGNVGSRLGQLDFGNQDGAVGATIMADSDATWGSGDYPGRLVFSTTADGASSPTEALRITNDRVIAYNQPAPTSKSAAATLTITELKTRIIEYTGAAATLTLPTGTLMEGGFSGIYTNMAFEWSVINTGSGICTIGAGTAHTIVGSAAVAIGASARFVSRRTAANTFVSYRLS